jgi:hypothetical protein
MLAGMNPPAPQGDDSTSGRVPGTGSPDQASGGGPSGSGQSGSADAKLNNDIQVLRAAQASLLEMAQSYPTATKALRNASEAIRAAQRQIVSAPGLSEPPVPNTPA